MTLNADHLSRRLSWRGVFAGLVMGIVSTLTIIALGTVITALTSISLTGAGVMAGIWSAIAALVGAYAAGLTAVRASAPSTHNDDGLAAMTHDDATMTGLITGGLIVLLTSMMAFNGARSLIGTATSAATTALGTAATGAAAAGAGAAQAPGVQDFFGGLSKEDVTAFIAENNADLNQQQVDATANVVSNIFRRAQYDLGEQNLANIGDFAKSRMEYIKKALSGEQFVTRLERQGLSNAQAREVQTEINQTVVRMEKQATDAAATAAANARIAARNAGLGWLLASGLTLLASVMGARSAATSRRYLATPVATANTTTTTNTTANTKRRN